MKKIYVISAVLVIAILGFGFVAFNSDNYSKSDLRQIARDPEFMKYFGQGLDSVATLDTDSDGIVDIADEDIDNDGTPNKNDEDRDGDGTPNTTDPSSALVKLIKQTSTPSQLATIRTSAANGAQGESGKTGAQGNRGQRGAEGQQGAHGSQGAAGEQGESGQQGQIGSQGSAGTDGSTGTTGAAGSAGTQGTTGSQGSQGQTGERGPKGEAGSQGKTGPQGETGPQGPQGETGTVGVVTSSGAIDTTLTGSDLDIQLLLATGSGLVQSSDGLSLKQTCTGGQVLKWNGTSWDCAADSGGIAYSPGAGITFSSGVIDSVLGAAVESDEIVNGTITVNDLDGDSVTSAKIVNGTIVTADLDSGSVTTSKIANEAIDSSKIADSSILFDDFASNGCTSNQVVKFNGASWECAADTDTNTDTDDQNLAWNAGTRQLSIDDGNNVTIADADTNTTYTAGTGLSLDSTTFKLDPGSLTATSSANGSDTFILHDGSSTKKISYDNLFSGVLGSLNYQGTWDASTNTPTLANADCTTAAKGDYYAISQDGSTTLSGISTWKVSDWVICNGTDWQRLQSTNTVSSVFGRTGPIIASAGDYSALQITYTPSGDIAADTVADALSELDSEKEANLTFVGNGLFSRSGNTISATMCSEGQLPLFTNGAWACGDMTESADTLYSGNGTLSGNRVVTLGGNALVINGTTGLNTVFEDNGAFSTGAASVLSLSVTADSEYLGLADFRGGINNSQGDLLIDDAVSISGAATLTDGGNLQFNDDDNSANIDITAPGSLADSYALTLPATDGDDGQVLATDGTGALAWTTPSGDSTWSLSGTNAYYNGGNVGIGTETPENKLHIAGSGNAVITEIENTGTGNALLQFTTDDGVNYIYQDSGNDTLRLGSLGAQLVIDNAGNVGIGTTTPTSQLDVVGLAKVDGLNINDAYTLPTTGGSSGQVLETNGSSVFWSAPNTPWIENGTASTYSYDRIGINDPSPSYDLDVNGSVRATVDVRADDDVVVDDDLYVYDDTFSYGNADFYNNEAYFESRVGIGGRPDNDIMLEIVGPSKAIKLVDTEGDDDICFIEANPGGLGVNCFQQSDRRLKSDIVDTETTALEYFDGFRIRDYTFDENNERMTGVIAQELQKTHPELVTDKNGKYLSVATPDLWLFVKAVQELDAKVTDLKDQVSLESINAALKDKTLVAGEVQTVKLSVSDRISVGGDVAGDITIPAGQTSLWVWFDKQYQNDSIVTASPQDWMTGQWRVSESNKWGFRIELQNSQNKDVTFAWHSLEREK